MCLGCGFRLPFKFYKTLQKEKLESCNIYQILIPFEYTIPNINKRFESETFIILDTRSLKKNQIITPLICQSLNFIVYFFIQFFLNFK